MKKHLVLILALSILLPLGTTFWMGGQALERDRDNVERRVKEALAVRLEVFGSRFSDVLESTRLELSQAAARMAMDEESLRDLGRRHPLIRQVYLLRGSELAFPKAFGGTMTESERHHRMKSLLEGEPLAPPAPERSAAGIEGEGVAEGWKTFLEQGTSLYFWKERPEGLLVFEINRGGLLSRLSAGLPGELENASDPEGHALQLLDERRKIFFQWGRYERRPEEVPLLIKDLPAPFQNWQWTYHLSPELRPGFGAEGAWFWGLAGMGLAAFLGLLLWYLQREIGRNLREAGQRVSFVNQVSHELKTPLTNLRLYADLLQSRLPEQSLQAREYLEIISSEAERLGRMIHNVLTFSRKDRRDRPQCRLTDWDEVCEAVIRSFRPAFRAKSLRLEWRPGGVGRLECDPDWVGQILANLISNAEKYASSGGVVEVSTGREAPSAWLRVADRGPGIPAKDRERIFQPFVRLSDQITDGTGGAGLGLFIARDLARHHGGVLILEDSEAGACFRLSIPLIGEKK